MQKYLIFLTLLVISCAWYAADSIYMMLYNNKTPYTVECKGIILDKIKVYAISNNKSQSSDTLCINFAQSRVIMPNTLGYIYYNNLKKEFVLKNHQCIYDDSKGIPNNYFLPYAKTLINRYIGKNSFGSSEIISQDVLVNNGVKYNTSVGTPENRVSVKLDKYGNQIYLITKDDGAGVKYLVKSRSKNLYDIVFNEPVAANIANVFLFDNTTSLSSKYTLEINANTFSSNYTIKDSKGLIIKEGHDSNPQFIVGGYVFSITPKYTFTFSILYLIFNAILIGFQIFFIIYYLKQKSPVFQSLLSIRILFNCIVFLATPLFLTSYYLSSGRLFYLFAVLLLNLSFFTSKTILHALDISKFKISLPHKKIYLFVFFALVLVCIKFLSGNECLFGIPILHVQQFIILLLIVLIDVDDFKSLKYPYWVRIAVILIYSASISLLTSDFGSIIYTFLAFLLVELVRKSIRLHYFIYFVVLLAGIVFAVYNGSPEKFSERKYYRLIAPYVTPESNHLSNVNEADKESYSTIFLNLKNIVDLKAPRLNEVVIATNMRSTCHSDFAFLWSLTFGGLVFLVIFIFVIIALIKDLVFLLFCSIREISINREISFAFPRSRESELVRYLLAFVIISFIYPVISNAVLIPLTGQSIPCLSISIIEVIFLLTLVVLLNSIFTNDKYLIKNLNGTYFFSDAKASLCYSLIMVFVPLLLFFLLRAGSLHYFNDTMSWTKHISDESIKINQQLPDYSDKKGLVAFAKSVIGKDKMTSVEKSKKPLLKNLASLYYFNKPYTQTMYESKVFVNSTDKLLRQMSVDSLFNNHSKIISGVHHPFGTVYSFSQRVNNKQVVKVSNNYYNSIPFDSQTLNADLTAECSKAIESHINLIGVQGNIGSVMIVENKTGKVLSNSSYPLFAESNSNQHHYFIGSLKKILIAYAALHIDSSYRSKIYGGKSFQEFLQYSDDYYAAALLRDLLLNHKEQLSNVLESDFDLPLYSLTDDAYLDAIPDNKDLKHELNRNNIIYRESIGQQKPYRFIDVMQWYARVASGLKVKLHDSNELKTYDSQSLNDSDRKFMLTCLNKVLYGTATVVRRALEKNHIKTNDIICKTGTSEKSDQHSNSSSSFILSKGNYTIGVMLKGTIPDNNNKLAAKDLFVTLIPVLAKYQVLQ